MRCFNKKIAGLFLLSIVSNFSHANVVNSTKSGIAVSAEPVLANKIPLEFSLSNPTVTVEDKAAEEDSLLNWCANNDGSSRVLINEEHNVYAFILEKGTLHDNLYDLTKSFYPSFQEFINRTNNHRVIGKKCIMGRSKKEVIQPIVESYFFQKQPILFATFDNDIAVMFYKNDPVMSKYLRIR